MNMSNSHKGRAPPEQDQRAARTRSRQLVPALPEAEPPADTEPFSVPETGSCVDAAWSATPRAPPAAPRTVAPAASRAPPAVARA
jgi:hypothetical protein